jgi:hypothetical protein
LTFGAKFAEINIFLIHKIIEDTKSIKIHESLIGLYCEVATMIVPTTQVQQVVLLHINILERNY